MNEFKDRVASNLNRKKYIIEENTVERNECGELVSFVAEEIRYDTPEKGKEGTPLNAENLNSIILEMINISIKHALENYHENGLAELENVESTILFDGSCAMYDSINIYAPQEVRVIVENNYSEYFSVSAPSTAQEGTLVVNITACQDPESSGATEFDFVVKLYSQYSDDLIKKVTCTVTFQVPSSSPED